MVISYNLFVYLIRSFKFIILNIPFIPRFIRTFSLFNNSSLIKWLFVINTVNKLSLSGNGILQKVPVPLLYIQLYN